VWRTVPDGRDNDALSVVTKRGAAIVARVTAVVPPRKVTPGGEMKAPHGAALVVRAALPTA